MTNIILLSLTLATNHQQAVVGQANGKALLADQETVAQTIQLGYVSHGKPISIGDFSRVLSTRLTTNAVLIAMPAPPTSMPIPPVTNAAPTISNTNSPGYKRRLEREQHTRSTTNAPPMKP
jgi:hypothetical protein